MKELVEALNELFSSNAAVSGKFFHKENGSLAEHAEALCLEYLIGANGCNFKNIAALEREGFRVFAVEKDSFGWLTGGVQKIGDNRVLTYC